MSNVDESNLMVSEAHLILDSIRKEKAERTKDIGDPIQLPGKALDVHLLGNDAWIAENTTVIRRLNLESGKTLQIYRGHTGPVTSIAFFEDDGTKMLLSGSWDQTIKIWNRETKDIISSTDAHNDFVKTLLVLPELRLLISGSSDKIVRFWDISGASSGHQLAPAGSISSHTRPVECLCAHAISPTSAEICTGDTMGVIKVWSLTKDASIPVRWRATLKYELNHHRTRINDMHFGRDELWTASADETVQVVSLKPEDASKPGRIITHPTGVRAILPLPLTDLLEPYLISGSGDNIRAYEVSAEDEPDLLGTVDAHWHDVTTLRLWIRKTTTEDGKTAVEPYVVSASLDGTLRKWRLAELLNPPKELKAAKSTDLKPVQKTAAEASGLTEEEERELAELMDEE
ncbi:WD40 repeat-like protein [Cylindrobasidium torrendii FP15055 ss-10]|uniref:WD40 repeat-like protein n=1 Tax=Cylindrobasidium torrendii FP15055 ss-10 TaxID=1314674 RepID=A0A0D7B3R6_9AGAR|nr:WD40 repeat-like protein [Cylindrobasidium torrendii FP15055 ss-10]